MKSDTTFKDEFTFLFDHVREALELQMVFSMSETLENHFNEPIRHEAIKSITPKIQKEYSYQIDASHVKITRLPDDFYESLIGENQKDTGAQTIFDGLYDFEDEDVIAVSADAYEQGSQLTVEYVQNLFVELGTEAFGLYMPMHKYFINKHNPWGIYLFPEIMEKHVETLHETFRDVVSYNTLRDYYFWFVYRHELFHFQTEHFATGLEVLMRTPYYLLYVDNIYHKYCMTEDCLEEALAEASVLESRLVSSNTGITSKLRKVIYRHDLDQMPGGYRDYACKKYGGVKEAHKHLAAQIIHLDKVHPKPTQINTINKEFIFNDKSVPVYKVTGLRMIRRFR